MFILGMSLVMRVKIPTAPVVMRCSSEGQGFISSRMCSRRVHAPPADEQFRVYGNRYSPMVILNGSGSSSPLEKVQYQKKTARQIKHTREETAAVEAHEGD